MLQAPAGYGKSTLLSQWRRELLQHMACCAWITLDASDREADSLARIVAIGIARSVPTAALTMTWHSGRLRDTGAMARRIVDRMASVPVQLVLILDEFEHIVGSPGAELIGALIEAAPPNLRVAIGTRLPLGLSLARLHAEGRVLQLGADDLRLTEQEAVQLLGRLVPERTARSVAARSEGWPVAVQLARLWLLKGSARARSSLTEPQWEGPIASYLAEQVLSELDGDLRSFLLDISLLDPLSIEICDAMRERSDSAALLARLRYLEAMIAPIDTESSSYRLHPIFRDHLRATLRDTDPTRKKMLHRRAGAIYAAHGEFQRAAHHASLADDVDLVLQIVDRAGGVLYGVAAGTSALDEIVDAVPDAMVERSPRLSLVRIYLTIKRGQIRRAQAMHEEWRRRHAIRLAALMDEDALLHAEDLLVDALLTIHRGPVDAGTMRRFRDAASRANGSASLACRLVAATIESYHYQQYGDLGAAERSLEEATGLTRELDYANNDLYMRLQGALIARARGNLEKAESIYRRVLVRTEGSARADSGLALYTRVLLAEILERRCELTIANQLVPDALEEIEDGLCWFDVRAAFYPLRLRLTVERAGLAAGELLRLKSKNQILQRDVHGLVPVVDAVWAGLLLDHGRVDQASAVVSEGRLEELWQQHAHGSALPWRFADAIGIALARLYIARGSPQRTGPLLARLLEDASVQQRRSSQIAILALDAVRRAAVGLSAAPGDDPLTRAAALSEQTSDECSLLATDPAVLPLLQELAPKIANPRLAAYVAALASRSADRTLVVDPLSPRELDVLIAIGRGHSNKVIARALDVSESTIKFHAKNLFRKLRARNRDEALTEARRRELIR